MIQTKMVPQDQDDYQEFRYVYRCSGNSPEDLRKEQDEVEGQDIDFHVKCCRNPVVRDNYTRGN